MKLEFDSVSDLQAFIDWAENFRGKPTSIYHIAGGGGAGGGSATIGTLVGVGRAGASAAAPDTPYPKIDTDGVAFDTPQGAVAPPGATETKTYTDGATATGPGPLPDQSPAQQDAEPAKRKRRTKAEIEAAAAAEAKPEEAAALAVVSMTDAGEASLEAARTTLRDKAASPTGTNPFEQVAHVGDGAASDTEGGEGPEAEADAVVTPFQHLTRAREFIAKHGMPKYNESFTKAGLDPNVMGYNAEQRAQHMATLAELDKT